MKKTKSTESTFMFYPEIIDENFNEKLYLKKEFRDVEIKEKDTSRRRKDFKLSEHQIFLRNYISPDTPYNGILVYHGVGSGKCLLKGTPIVMNDGTIRNVENIKEGDLLMGDDSKPRKVLSLARGRDRMYSIKQKNNDTYTVNSEHILCLKANNYPLYKVNNNNIIIEWLQDNEFYYKKFDKLDKDKANRYFNLIQNSEETNSNILEISIKRYLDLPIDKKNILFGYRVPIELPKKNIDNDPYNIGYNLLDNENLLDDYKYNHSTVRLELLAGILDKYSILNKKNNYEILKHLILNENKLIKDIFYIVKSLGYNIKRTNNKLIIFGNDLYKIPIRIESNKINNLNKNNNSLEYNIKVKYLRYDDYYGFTLDGNCRFLLGDFTVTHNTCTAISIAEGFKKTLKNINKKVLVLTYLKKNFQKELFDFEKERRKHNPEDIVQCTGREYELTEDMKYLSFQQREKEVIKMIKSYYQFFGYGEFAHYIIKRTNGWKGEEKDMNEKIRTFIENEFNDRIIIIDEIQNIKTDKNKELTKSIQPLLQNIIKYGKNIKLILMSATPMYDRPDEIIFYINLLLENDGREKVDKNDIFNSKDGTLKENADKLLRELFTGYVSFVRAEKPYDFPFRIYPKTSIIPKIEYYIDGKRIDKNRMIKYTKLELCIMNGIQEKTYIHYLEKKIKDGQIQEIVNNENNNLNNEIVSVNDKHNNRKDLRILHDLINISNITFPVDIEKNKDQYGSFSKISIDLDYDSGLGGYYKTINVVGTKKRIQYKYQSHAIFNKDTISEAPFTDEKYLHRYSAKFASILQTVKKSKGLIFIFSNFIEQGVLPLALMLEQNGFDRECIEGEDQLLNYYPNKVKGGGKKKQVCYWCGNDAKFKDHIDEKSKDFHVFKRAKYILYFVESKEIIKIKKNEALEKFSSNRNRYGEEVKIFIGTRAVSEGLDFKRLRQVHILEPWYNLSRHEQIIGRAIRFRSHDMLLPEENNVEIFQYASILSPKNKYGNRESVDLKNYRLAENKDIIIKKISRIMKESAVDCVFLKDINVINTNKKEKQITSSGDIIYIDVTDKPFSSLCDYQDKCNYTCNWEPNPRIKYPINTDTYNIYFAQNDIIKIKKEIKLMFKENIVYHLQEIENHIINSYKDINKIFIYSALEDIVNNKNEILYDKFGRKGYIIYRGDYYIFQPIDLDRTEMPLIYRMYPLSIKPDTVNLDNIKYDYKIDNNKNNSNNNLDNTKILDNIYDKINSLYEKYLYIGKDNKKILFESIIGYLMNKMNRKDEINYIKQLLTSYINNDNNRYNSYIIDYLLKRNKLINFYADIEFDQSKIKDKVFVGFIIYGQYFILNTVEKTKSIKSLKKDIKFVECTKDIILKIKAYRNITKKNNVKFNRDYNIIYGTIDINSKDKKLKIIDKSIETDVLTKDKKISKRSIITGRVCTTYHSTKLLEIRKIIGLEKTDLKKKIDDYCQEIEIYLRFKELIKDNNKIWFIEPEY
jgi:hypothetical protein